MIHNANVITTIQNAYYRAAGCTSKPTYMTFASTWCLPC